MKCFNHPERDAVATCQKCGKGLCQECAAKHTPCLCDSCAAQAQQDQKTQALAKEEQKKQKYKDALVDTVGELIKVSVVGIIVGILGVWWMSASENSSGQLDSVGGYVLSFFMWFCVPFGWKFFTWLQSFIPLVLFGTWWFWLIYLIVKTALSLIAGVPAFLFQLVKTILKTVLIKRKSDGIK